MKNELKKKERELCFTFILKWSFVIFRSIALSRQPMTNHCPVQSDERIYSFLIHSTLFHIAQCQHKNDLRSFPISAKFMKNHVREWSQ